MPAQDDFVERKEAARCFRVSLATIDRAVKRGELRCARIGRLIRFKRRWLDELADRRHGKNRRETDGHHRGS